MNQIRLDWIALASFVLWSVVGATQLRGDESDPFRLLAGPYERQIRPLLQEYCFECHSQETQEGQLNLEQFTSLEEVRRDPAAYQKVAQMLASGEMPPRDNRQPSLEQTRALVDWLDRYLHAEALAHAGDPGPVVLRRLNNAEYTYTVQDLTGIPLSPAEEFPVDSAAGEGFTNTGNALVMSPALLVKYLDAGKAIAEHAVLLPDGIRFSGATTRRDWSNEIVERIRGIYLRHTSGDHDVNLLNRWSVDDPRVATALDGQVDLEAYFQALVRHRAELQAEVTSARAVAELERLNPKYFERLAHALLFSSQSLLLDDIGARLRRADASDVTAITADVRTWQDLLWKYNSVGHFGSIRPWQEPVTPLVDSETRRVPLDPAANAAADCVVSLRATPLRRAPGDSRFTWQEARLEYVGRAALSLQDVPRVFAAIQQLQAAGVPQTARCLTAALARRDSATFPLDDMARSHDVDPKQLAAWRAFLGLDTRRHSAISGYLNQSLRQIGGQSSVSGWGQPGVADLSLVSNSSEASVRIPGELRPHSIAVHPRPERWVAVGWRSPGETLVRLAAEIRDAHNCGNGVEWSLLLDRQSQTQVLRHGQIDTGGETRIELPEEFAVKTGDVVSLRIGPRDGDHACDLTDIELTLSELQGEKRHWSLRQDCADSIEAGNPHADPYGNEAVWHFYSGPISDADSPSAIPPGSLLARLLAAGDTDTIGKLANEIQLLIENPLRDPVNEADRQLYHLLLGLEGPFLQDADFDALTRLVPEAKVAGSPYGLPAGSDAANPHELVVGLPSLQQVRLPTVLCQGATLAVTAVPASETQPAQAQVTYVWADNAAPLVDTSQSSPADQQSIDTGREVIPVLAPAIPILARRGSPAEAAVREAFAAFRELFPRSMCYARIVPVDEVVTLMLYHREDEPLVRLMLDDPARLELDRLWDELHYVSQDALKVLDGLEQLLEFATQDSDPKLFLPLRKPLEAQATEFRTRLLVTEPAHVDAVVRLAARAYRRPLEAEEEQGLRELYQALRRQEVPHDPAIRLLLARIFAAPAFLYRLETRPPGVDPQPVTDPELAARLSYFLWSSLPDAELQQIAGQQRLGEDESLRQQTRRMVRDPRVRRLAIQFACQWLQVRDFDQTVEKNEQLYPEFGTLRGEMYEESIQFFTHLFQDDESILSILEADHTYLNARLAEYYQIPGIRGEQWQRVEGVRGYGRGGVLGFATTLASQSGASRTSPILRGNWVSETLLGERLPRPPKNVPQLPETVPGDLTERQLIEKHSSDAACVRCHERIDPYGFALENFDAIGRFRQTDEARHPIKSHSQLRDGTALDGVDGLRAYLATERRDAFLKHFCRKLLGYALGRAVQLSDEPLLAEIQAKLPEHDYRVSTAIETIVLSRQFRTIRGMGQSN